MEANVTLLSLRARHDIDDRELSRHIGSRIRQRRQELHLRLKDVAQACGMRFQQLQKLEVAKNNAFAHKLWRIAGVLGVPVSYFYEGLADVS